MNLQKKFGTSTFKLSNLPTLGSEFENLCIGDDETIVAFNERLRDIINQAYQLQKKYLESKLVIKTLRSLSERFATKVVVIEEVSDMDDMYLDELIHIRLKI